MNYNQPHKFYCGVDLHARSMFTHVLDHKGKTVFEQDLAADPDEFLHALKPFRKNIVVGCECMFAWVGDSGSPTCARRRRSPSCSATPWP